MDQNKALENDLPVDLSQPARRALAGAGYQRLDQLAGVRASDLKKLHGIGPKAMLQIRRDLKLRGLSLAED
jgi:hypothetical protein